MNGYVVGGYLTVLLSIGTYALFLVARLRASRRRLSAAVPSLDKRASEDAGSSP
jgi:hypothetical protein